MKPLFLTKETNLSRYNINKLLTNTILMILLMACAKMDEKVLLEHIRRSFGNNYEQNKNKYRKLLKGLCSVRALAS